MTYENQFTPDCLPTQALKVAVEGSIRVEMPSRRDLARAMPEHGRVVGAYELVCSRLAETRLALARIIPDNWTENEDDIAAVEILGGIEVVYGIRGDGTVAGAKLP